jgi:hypothetical protein
VKNAKLLDCGEKGFVAADVRTVRTVGLIHSNDREGLVNEGVRPNEVDGFENNGLKMLILWLWLNETVGFVISVQRTLTQR